MQPSGSHGTLQASNLSQRTQSPVLVGLWMSSTSQSGETAGLVITSAQTSVSGLQMVQQPKQSQPGGTSPMHWEMHCMLKAQSLGGQLPKSPASHWFWVSRQQVSIWQLPPLLPSKKQSCFLASLLSPGMPVAKLASSLSSGPAHCGSSPSMKLSPSSSSQL